MHYLGAFVYVPIICNLYVYLKSLLLYYSILIDPFRSDSIDGGVLYSLYDWLLVLYFFACVHIGCRGLLHGKTRVRPIGGWQRGLHAVARSVFAGPLSHSQVVASVRGRCQRQRPRRHTVSTHNILSTYTSYFKIINNVYILLPTL